MKLKDMVVTALMTAVLCVMAPWSIPVGAVPVTLASFAVYLCAAILGFKRGTVSVVLYVLLGAVGVPVFSGFSGGFQKLAGVTGGYIAGYILCALIVGLAVDKWETRSWVFPLSMAAGTAALYALGTVWFTLQMETTFAAALVACVVPFLIGDVAKIAVASAVAIPLRRTLKKHGLL